MPSIANQDFKIYGKLSENAGVPAKYCGELYAAYCRAKSITKQASFVDGFVFDLAGGSICQLLNSGMNYIDAETEQIESIGPSHSNPEYYDALWAIQQAEYAADGSIAEGGMSFLIGDNNSFVENEAGLRFINEDGYLIKGTIADGKLASLSLGEKVELTIGIPVVRLESLLPLVGELPLGTTKIW